MSCVERSHVEVILCKVILINRRPTSRYIHWRNGGMRLTLCCMHVLYHLRLPLNLTIRTVETLNYQLVRASFSFWSGSYACINMTQTRRAIDRADMKCTSKPSHPQLSIQRNLMKDFKNVLYWFEICHSACLQHKAFMETERFIDDFFKKIQEEK